MYGRNERNKFMKPRFLNAYALMIAMLCLIPMASAQYQPFGPDSVNQAVPPELVLPAGTLIMVRTTDFLSSSQNRAGDDFTAILDQPLVAQGWVVARRGQTVIGQVEVAEKAGRGQRASQLGVSLAELMVVDGSQVPVRTELIQSSANGPSRRDIVSGIGATTGIGAVIGAIAGGGKGAAIGAAVGAAAGSVAVLSTQGKPTELYPETRLTFRLQEPVTILTQLAQQAFRPVSQSDYAYAESRPAARTYRNAESYPPRYYPPYYYYPGWDYYNGYGGFGATIVVSPRSHGGDRGHRGRR
jgi:outer membrane lipoprotein SlyB